MYVKIDGLENIYKFMLKIFWVYLNLWNLMKVRQVVDHS